MIPLNYNQLYYFYKIAEAGSMSQASQNILVSSPALSMQLKELEESLGTALFLRVGKKLVLTEAGLIVQEYAKDIFKLGFELRDTLSDRNPGTGRAKIEIGCQDAIPKKIADELIEFLIDKKRCKVTMREGNREHLMSMQNAFKLDLILTNSPSPANSSSIIESKLLCRERLIVVGHPKFRPLKKKWPQSLKNAPFVLPTYDSTNRQKLESYFKESGLTVDVVAEVEDSATELDLALKGHALVAVMKICVTDLLKTKELIEIGTLGDLDEEVWMHIGKRKILNPGALFAMKNFTLLDK